MTAKEFIIWLKGFSEACHHLNPTPQQWEKILETLNTVKEESKTCTCEQKTYTYPYQGYMGDNTITNNASKQILND